MASPNRDERQPGERVDLQDLDGRGGTLYDSNAHHGKGPQFVGPSVHLPSISNVINSAKERPYTTIFVVAILAVVVVAVVVPVKMDTSRGNTTNNA